MLKVDFKVGVNCMHMFGEIVWNFWKRKTYLAKQTGPVSWLL